MPITKNLCPTLQQDINEIAGNNAPALKRDATGYLNAVQSPENKNGFQQILQIAGGKVRPVTLIGNTRDTDANVATVRSLTCVSTNERDYYENTFNLTNVVEYGQKFDVAQMRRLCDGDKVHKAKMINSSFNAMAVKLNKLLLARQNASFGNFISGVNTAKSIQLMTDTIGEPRSFAVAKMIKEYEDALAVGRPMLIGSGNLDLFMKQKGIACCSLTTGTDLSRADDFSYYKDQYAESVFGAKEFAILMPGAVQLVTRNENIGDYAMSNDVFEKSTITDPFTGLTYDYSMKYDDCLEVYSIFMRLYYDLVFVNANGYSATDPLFGVNNTFNFIDTSIV